VLAVESFLADIAQNVAGDRLRVDTLMPLGLDPHGWEPAPGDLRRVAESDVLIENGAGLEGPLARLLDRAGGERLVIEAAAGLTPRVVAALGSEAAHEAEAGSDAHGASPGDPHFYLDPVAVMRYVANIRDGLSRADPAGAAAYAASAERYTAELQELDAELQALVNQVPAGRRKLVTNHDSLGYFADRYGLEVVGTVLPGASPEAQPSARALAELADRIRAEGVPALFVEASDNPALARRLAEEAGVRLVDDLLTHSLTGPDGEAPTYLAMMRYNARRIVEALK
jgi:ABC-type Zn uptake system ZnuABC Zn-binding protein ZnuA